MILAIFCIGALIRQYGVSTANSDGLLPTPWETGWAPYVLGLLVCVLVATILAAVGHRLGRCALMAVTTVYTACLLYWGGAFFLSLPYAQIHWTGPMILSAIESFVVIITWWFISYWGLFKASLPNQRRADNHCPPETQ